MLCGKFLPVAGEVIKLFDIMQDIFVIEANAVFWFDAISGWFRISGVMKFLEVAVSIAMFQTMLCLMG